jgi:hypothetical protein
MLLEAVTEQNQRHDYLPSISRTTDLPVTPCLAGRRLGLALMRPAIFVTSQAWRSISSAIRSHLQRIDSGLNNGWQQELND